MFVSLFLDFSANEIKLTDLKILISSSMLDRLITQHIVSATTNSWPMLNLEHRQHQRLDASGRICMSKWECNCLLSLVPITISSYLQRGIYKHRNKDIDEREAFSMHYPKERHKISTWRAQICAQCLQQPGCDCVDHSKDAVQPGTIPWVGMKSLWECGDKSHIPQGKAGINWVFLALLSLFKRVPRVWSTAYVLSTTNASDFLVATSIRTLLLSVTPCRSYWMGFVSDFIR